jgi:hypothetical protein
MAEPGWISFYTAAAEIERRFGGSQADAQKRLRRACVGERVRSMLAPYEIFGGTFIVEAINTWTRIAPSKWHEAQPDYASDGWIVMVSENDFQHWLNSEPQIPKPRSIRSRRKRSAAEQAIEALWREGIPDGLANKEVVKEVSDRLQKENLPVPHPDTILRAAGRK